MPLTNEERLIELYSRLTVDEERQARAEQILTNELDWNYIAKRASGEDISSILSHNLNKFGIAEAVPCEFREQWKDDYIRVTFRNLMFLEERDKISKSFKEVNIPMIVLKGAFLLENVYINLGLRPMGDVDILIKKNDITATHHRLTQLRYSSSFDIKDIGNLQNSPASHYINSIVYVKNGDMRLCLNVHWHLANSITPLYLATKINMDRIWQDAEPFKDMMAMAPHHLLIHLAEHAFRHCFNRFILMVDIAEVLAVYKNKINWEKFLRDSFAFGLEKRIFYSLYLASCKFGACVPRDILFIFEPKKKTYGEKIFLRHILSNIRFEELSCFASLYLCKNLSQRMRFLKELAFPPREVLAQAYLRPKGRVNLLDYFSRMFRGVGYIARGYLR